MASNSDGRLEVFEHGWDGALWHIWQSSSSPTGWSDWDSLQGAIVGDPAVGLNDDGRLEVFASGADGALWHIWQTHPHAGPWSGWQSLHGHGDGNSPSAAIVNQNGMLEVFLSGTDGEVRHIWQTHPHAGPWSPVAALGSHIGNIVVVPNYANGRLELFGNAGLSIKHTWKDTSSGAWIWH
jgi:hypothetical protein